MTNLLTLSSDYIDGYYSVSVQYNTSLYITGIVHLLSKVQENLGLFSLISITHLLHFVYYKTASCI